MFPMAFGGISKVFFSKRMYPVSVFSARQAMIISQVLIPPHVFPDVCYSVDISRLLTFWKRILV